MASKLPIHIITIKRLTWPTQAIKVAMVLDLSAFRFVLANRCTSSTIHWNKFSNYYLLLTQLFIRLLCCYIFTQKKQNQKHSISIPFGLKTVKCAMHIQPNEKVSDKVVNQFRTLCNAWLWLSTSLCLKQNCDLWHVISDRYIMNSKYYE